MDQKQLKIAIDRERTRMERLQARRRRARMRLLAIAVLVAAAAVIYGACAHIGGTPGAAEETQPKKASPSPAPQATEEPEAQDLEITAEERELIARVVYLEAGGEPAAGQQAVAEVILNRLAADNFPETVEEIIHQDRPAQQFASSEHLETAEPGEDQYAAVDAALHGVRILPDDVVYFDVRPENDHVWGTIGNHVFCYQYTWD